MTELFRNFRRNLVVPKESFKTTVIVAVLAEKLMLLLRYNPIISSKSEGLTIKYVAPQASGGEFGPR